MNGSKILQLIPTDSVNTLSNKGTNKTLSIMFIDKSGSMQRFGQTPLDCLNNHLQTLQTPPDGREQYCTVISFTEEATVELPLTKVSNGLKIKSYEADGGTLLWETVYQTLKVFLQMHKNLPDNDSLQVVVGVFSDGEDNWSFPERQPRKLKKIAQRALEFGWHLYSYGIGIDAKKLASDMGFPTDDDHAKTVLATPEGLQEVTQHFSINTTTIGCPADFFKVPPPRTTSPEKP